MWHARRIASSKRILANPSFGLLTWAFEVAPRAVAPRAGFEPAAYCLGGIPRTSPDVAGCGLMWRSAAPTVAGRGSASPSICRRWLPVWLPGISLASLTSGPIDNERQWHGQPSLPALFPTVTVWFLGGGPSYPDGLRPRPGRSFRIRMMVVLPRPVILWMYERLSPAATACRMASSRSPPSQWRSSSAALSCSDQRPMQRTLRPRSV